MEVSKIAAVFVMSVLLAGCPRETPITLYNHTGARIDVVSDGGSETIDKDGHTTLSDFSFDRDAMEAQVLRLRGNFGESCHQLMFAGLGYSDQDLGTYADSGTLLAVLPSGDVRLIRSTPSTLSGAVPIEVARAGARLPVCDTPIRKR